MKRYLTFLLVSLSISAGEFEKDFLKAGLERTTKSVRYDPKYVVLDYPNGDVASNIGVCTDVIIRSYRALGIDLQKLVHEDMRENFSSYPSKRIWGLKRPDKNIDHRRVPNLEKFFSRHGKTLRITKDSTDYKPGDLITWRLPGNLPHIGIVSDKINEVTGNPMIIHNISRGPELEDMLFDFKIVGHYRWEPKKYKNR